MQAKRQLRRPHFSVISRQGSGCDARSVATSLVRLTRSDQVTWTVHGASSVAYDLSLYHKNWSGYPGGACIK